MHKIERVSWSREENGAEKQEDSELPTQIDSGSCPSVWALLLQSHTIRLSFDGNFTGSSVLRSQRSLTLP